MQDIRSIGCGRIFSGGGGGGAGGGDRRLRPHHHHHQNNQALKCPRCDSINTKFCYYNNYNLSQPRHFCKGCRRYWTKGGVLRNVPVGGGCRKAKRSKTKSSSEATATAASAPPQLQQQQRDQRKENSHSSSESSSLTAANSNAAATNNNNNNNNNNTSVGGSAEAVSAVTSHSNLINVSDSKYYGNPNNLGLEPGLLEQGSDCGIFSEIGSFTSLITSSNNETQSFGFGTVLSGQAIEQGHWQQQQQQKMMSMGGEGITGGLLDQTVQVELSNLHSRSDGGGCGGFGPLDWEGSGDQGLFDLPNTVDQTYWSQTQWTDHQDHPALYLP